MFQIIQGYGRSLWQMHGMFRANGGCGYVKKPDFLIDGDSVFDPKAELPFKTVLKVDYYYTSTLDTCMHAPEILFHLSSFN